MSRYKANMPSVGITSFLKLPIIENLSNLNTDVGFLGIPYDVGNSWRPGTRFGPREIRNYSTKPFENTTRSFTWCNVPPFYWWRKTIEGDNAQTRRRRSRIRA